MEISKILEKTHYSFKDHPVFRNKKILSLDVSDLPFSSNDPNLDVFPARLLNLSYAEYLRFCNDVLKAEIVGKRQPKPTVLFEINDNTKMFVRLLNKRIDYILYLERER